MVAPHWRFGEAATERGSHPGAMCWENCAFRALPAFSLMSAIDRD